MNEGIPENIEESQAILGCIESYDQRSMIAAAFGMIDGHEYEQWDLESIFRTDIADIRRGISMGLQSLRNNGWNAMVDEMDKRHPWIHAEA
ncbi:hypothetical protein FJZ28_03000 [Candidatus Peregrinibacteria bacterium]|nr:hypothetical protein [Candidatus Peregrinibacteria bacterium]